MNSTPQVAGRDRGVVAQGAQLNPGDLRMDAAVWPQSVAAMTFS